MQDEPRFDTTRNELLNRLKALESPQESGNLSELAYRRAREALEKALDEARTIRLQAIEDARNSRERELAALTESLSNLRQSAVAQIDSLLREAEIESEQIRDQARNEADFIIENAVSESASTRAEAAAIRNAAEERAREVERMEADFNAQLERIARRLGMTKPKKPWYRK